MAQEAFEESVTADWVSDSFTFVQMLMDFYWFFS